MKRFRIILSWLLVCVACFALPHGARAAEISEFQKTLAKEGTDAAWALITPEYHTVNDYQQEGYSEVRV